MYKELIWEADIRNENQIFNSRKFKLPYFNVKFINKSFCILK